MIKLFELELNKKGFAVGFHGCPVNRVNTITGNTKGGSGLRQNGGRIPFTIGSCSFTPPQTRTQESSRGLAGAFSSQILSRFELFLRQEET